MTAEAHKSCPSLRYGELHEVFVTVIFVLQDFSHYTVVCEAGPGDRCLEEAVRELAPRVHHIHARIGCENSPQVPAAPHALWSQPPQKRPCGAAQQQSLCACVSRAHLLALRQASSHVECS